MIADDDSPVGTSRPGSKLERTFETRWRQLGGPELVAEHRFHPVRRWRFDFAHPGCRVAIELEGGVFSQGRHIRGVGFTQDCEKYNAAALLDWRVFRFTGGMLEADPWGHLKPIIELIKEDFHED